jgi:hypothetical protein
MVIIPPLNITAQDIVSTSTTAGGQTFITGTPTAASALQAAIPPEDGAVLVQVTGTWTGTLSLEVSADGVVWVALYAYQPDGLAPAVSFTTNFVRCVSTGPFAYFRVRATAAWIGTAVVLATSAESVFATAESVTASQGAPNTHANGWWSRITDGVRDLVVKASNTIASAADTSIATQIINGGSDFLVLPLVNAGTDGVITQTGTTSRLTSTTLDATGVKTGSLFAVTDATHSANTSAGWTVTAHGTNWIEWTNGSGVATASGVVWTRPPYDIATACADKFTASTRPAGATQTASIMSPSGVSIIGQQPNKTAGAFNTLPPCANFVFNVSLTQINLQSMAADALGIVVWL